MSVDEEEWPKCHCFNTPSQTFPSSLAQKVKKAIARFRLRP